MKTLTINNLEFAQKQLKLADNIAILNLKRLQELLVLNDENVKLTAIYFELIGDSERFRQPSLQLLIKSQLPVICQRCLSEMMINLELNFDYLISNSPVNNLGENDEIDWIEAETEMNLQELIEDELLLAMPIAPVHNENCNKLSMQSGEKPNPFAILKDKIKTLKIEQ
jgi:uncharacterized protein